MLYATGSDALDGSTSELSLWKATGERLEQVASIPLISPSWVEPHPNLPILYSVQETVPGKIIAITISAEFELHASQRIDAGGGLPCHLAVRADGAALAVANYADGTVTVIELDANGRLGTTLGHWQLSGSGPNALRQDRSHAHATLWLGNSLLIVDLGSDALYIVNEQGTLAPLLRFPAGFGPRHIVRIGTDRAAVVGELSAEVALITLGLNPRILCIVPTTNLAGAQPSGIALHDGFVVVANRGVGTLTVFSTNEDELRLQAAIVLPGKNPRAITALHGLLLVCLQDVGQLLSLSSAAGQLRRVASAPLVADVVTLPEWTPTMTSHPGYLSGNLRSNRGTSCATPATNRTPAP